MRRAAGASLVSLTVIRRADRLARSGFTYVADPPGRDTWVSHAAVVRAGQAWRGDCDDLGATALELAVEMGADPARLYRALVASPDCPPGVAFDHYVALAEVEGGVWWVFGDTYQRPIPLDHSGHRVHAAARVSDGLDGWRRWAD